MSFTDDQKKALMSSLPRDAVKNRKQAGQTLSYVEGWWVKDQLLEIFGPGAVGMDIVGLREVASYEDTDKRGNARSRVSYAARVKIRITVDGQTWESEDVGAGHGMGDLGSAHESAAKEAVTDAMKRAATFAGRRLGLALYDKDKEHVGESDGARAMIERINAIISTSDLDALGKEIKAAGFDTEDLADVRKAFASRKREIGDSDG